jgi:acyl dehydratase
MGGEEISDRDGAGTDLGSIRFPLQRSKLIELAHSFKDRDPVWYDPEAAAAAGFAELPMLPTATVIADHWREAGAVFHAVGAGLDMTRVLHGEASWEYLRPLRVDDELTATSTLLGIERRKGKRGGEMRLARVETTFVNQRGELAVRRFDTLIETAPK